MDIPTVVIIVLLLIIGTCFLILTPKSRIRKSGRLPPGPIPYPIIGNILSLGSHPHRSLAKLSRKYGPLMSLKLGTRTTIVVSSPDIAKVVLQKHDLSFSSRTIPASLVTTGLDNESIVWSPVGARWRKLRKICKEEMFSVNKLDAGQGLRRDKVQKLYDHVKECCAAGRVVNIGEAAFITTLNLISTTLFSKEFASFNSSSAQENKEVVWGVMKCVGKPNIVDYFPWLKHIDPQGISREMKFHFDNLFTVFAGIIEEKMKSGCTKNDLTDVLIDINRKDNEELSQYEINRLLLDLFVAGTDTTAATVEWAMTELLRHPDKMSTARAEIQEIIGEKNEIQESDIPHLPYLQAVVKETLRLHPTAPFLIPHKANSDVEINGHIIPKDSQILISMWAIGRDLDTWVDAESFIPERFLYNHSKVEFKGQNFELIPFGAGRRTCPGLPLADRMMHLMIGTLIHKFGWKLEDGVEPKSVDMSEKFGITLQKAKSLKAIPVLEF